MVVMFWLIGYVACVIFFTSGSYAYWVNRFAILDSSFERRSHMAFSLGMNLIPLFWIVTLFTTGFFYYGFQLRGGLKERFKR